MTTIAQQINAALRHVAFDTEGNVITLSQTFPTSADDLWEACTTPARLARWFEPVTGDLRRLGRYRLSDSGTEGTIEECDAPRSLVITWEYGDDRSRVAATIAPTEDGARLTITHRGNNSEHWREYGPAAGGTGWDLSLLGLAFHLEDPTTDAAATLVELMASPEGSARMSDFADVWCRAHVDAGADPSEATRIAAHATQGNRELWAG